MAITISVSDVNGDGSGINFSQYLAAFETTFEKSGYGAFSDPTDDTGLSAEAYVSTDEDGPSVIFGSGSDDWTYDMTTHVISGSLSTIQFGSNTVYDEDTDTYSNNAEIKISGLGIADTSTSSGTMVNDLMNSDTDSLVAYLKANDLVFKGSTGDDVFTAYSHNDTLSGGNGDDTLKGGAGTDKLLGGAGDDTLVGGSGNDTLSGSVGDDSLTGSVGTDILNGGDGKDALSGGEGKDTLSGGKGNDTLSGGAGNDTLGGGVGNDTLSGGDGNDVLTGSDGADTLSGGNDNDTLYGGDGNDTLAGGDGKDVLIGGAGNDTLAAGAGDDTLTGGLGNDKLTGGSGADTFIFIGKNGTDTITDFAEGSAGTDVITFDNNALNSYADVLAAATDTDAGLMISFSGGSVLLTGVVEADLHKSDFDFV
jgi:serralysin